MSTMQNCSIYHCKIIIHLVLPTTEKEKNSRTSEEEWGFQQVNTWLKKKNFVWLCQVLVQCVVQNVGSSFPSRDQTWAPCIGSTES